MNLPGYRPPNNAVEAAGWFDREFAYTCTEWICPQDRYACRISDWKKSSEFMPFATDPQNGPEGCRCDSFGWHYVPDPKTWTADEFLNNVSKLNTIRETSPGVWNRFLKALEKMPRRR